MTPSSHLPVHVDAFSSGQISSKIWLCEQLEEALERSEISRPVIWILAGWYGLSAFLLLSRGRAGVAHVRSFDIDPRCQGVADMINENWIWQKWKFKAFTADCLELDFSDSAQYGPKPQVVINTSIEHMANKNWWEHIPIGTFVALQSCDMDHEEHSFRCQDLSTFAQEFPLQKVIFEGERNFKYPEWEFTRFMRIGIK